MRLTPLLVIPFAALLAIPAPSGAQSRDRRDREREEELEQERRERDEARRERDRDRRERERELREARAERERDLARERARRERMIHVVRVDRRDRYRDRYRDRWRESRRNVSLMVGVLDYDFAADGDDAPMAALRGDWRLTRWLRSEVDATYALASVPAPIPPGGPTGDDDRNSSLGSATVGLQAELPIPYVRPYVGAAVGLFARRDEDEGSRFVRPTTAFPVGVRVALSRRLALRGEVRFRYDQHEDNTTARDVEKTVGISVGF